MAKKLITVTIDKAGFTATESFMSKFDAQAWKEMVLATLKHRQKVDFDLTIYTAGLAETVRAYGGAYTKDKWLNIEVPYKQWVRGLPVKLDYEAMITDVVQGEPAPSLLHSYASKVEGIVLGIKAETERLLRG